MKYLERNPAEARAEERRSETASGNGKLAGYAGVKDAEVNNSLPTQGGGAGDRETLRQALVYARYHVELSPASDKAEALAKIDAALQAAPSEGWQRVRDDLAYLLTKERGHAQATIIENAIAYLDANRSAPSEGGEPVAWRWRLKEWASGEWAHRDEYAGWADDDRFEFQPLYARPPAPSEGPLVGCVVVPRDPTEAMLAVALDNTPANVSRSNVSELWRAMLAAAPSPDANPKENPDAQA